MSLIKFATTVVAAATISQLSIESLYQRAVFAQSPGATPVSFPIPEALPNGTTLKVDGSTSMRLTNETLEDRFEQQFPNVDIELDASRTDTAFAALIQGDIDVLATGRPLTDAEKAQGVVEVPLEQREKLAIILGPNNGFKGDLTFDQFARIFRGEISNWSDVGGPNVPIRLVDRPDYSDTRRALGTYDVFEGKPFSTGTTAAPVTDDETATVINALGNDGIGYAVVSQVIDRDDVRIIPMHQTLPDDPRYPYSQYRAFVYKQGANPAALAFLGFATTEPGQEVFASTPATTAATDSSAGSETPAGSPADSETPGGSSTAPGGSPAGLAAAPGSPTDSETPAGASSSDPAESTDPSNPAGIPGSSAGPESLDALDPATDAAAAAAADDDQGGFPFWLLPLLVIPLLGALLWWLLKNNGVASSGGGTVAAAGAAAPLQPRMVLTPRDHRNAYAYWEISPEQLADTKRQGGETMMLRLYDVTGRSKHTPLPAATAEFPCLEANPDLHLPIAVDDRSYCAEVGYLDKDNQWLPIVKSDPVRVPVAPKDGAPSASSLATNTHGTTSGTVNGTMGKPAGDLSETNPSETNLSGAALGAAALGAAALGVAGAAKLTKAQAKPPVDPGRMVLTPRHPHDIHAHWQIPQERLADAKLQGGDTLMAKLYDITDRPADAGLPAPTAQLDCTETDTDILFHVTSEQDSAQWDSEREYVAEIGYQTASHSWLPLAQSNSVRLLPVASDTGATTDTTSTPPADNSANNTDATSVIPPSQGTTQIVNVHSRTNALMFDQGQQHHIEHNVAVTHPLMPGLYTLRLRDGVFNYDADDNHPGEPFVLLWVHGGTVINQKTGVPVSSTWTTLNGYDDTLILEVREPAKLCAFFVDTYPDDNSGEVTLSVIQQ